MENSAKITIEDLAVALNGKMWVKEDLKRIYLDEGYNTKKMSTKTYVEIRNGEFVVRCFIDCPSQNDNWIDSQQDQIIERVEQEIAELLVTEYFYVVNENNQAIDDCKKIKDIAELYTGGGLYISKSEALEFIENLSSKNYLVLSISRSELEKQVAKLDAIEREKNEQLKLIQIAKDEEFKSTLIQSLVGKTEFEKKTLCFDAWKSLDKGSFKDEIFEMFEYYKSIAVDEEVPEDVSKLPSEGKKVSHARFGTGIITEEIGEGSDKKLNIIFSDGSEKLLLERFANLTYL